VSASPPPPGSAGARLLPPELLARLRPLQLRAHGVVDGVLSGLHRSPLHGASVEFAEHKEYAPGDEVRHVDWRVFGKSDKVYIKRYQHETNLQATIVLDASSSMLYRSPDAALSKWDHAASLAAAIAYLVLRQQDSVGLLLASEAVRTWVPPRAQMNHLWPLCEAIVSHKPKPRVATSLIRAGSELVERLGRRGPIFFISDFFESDPRWFRQFEELERRGHHVTLLQVLDPWEASFPFEDLTVFRSLESGVEIATEPRLIAATYRAEFQRFVRELASSAATAGMEHRVASTDIPIDRLLADLFARRASDGATGAAR
jgi:uncharacterized protein (DUF58 family)